MCVSVCVCCCCFSFFQCNVCSPNKYPVLPIQELSHWENVYGQRSYCNFTFIAEDTSTAARSAGQMVHDKLQPLYQAKVLPIYETYLKETVEKVRPKLQPAVVYLQKGLDFLSDMVSWGLEKMSFTLKSKCPRVQSSLKSWEKNNNASFHRAIVKSVDATCSEPDQFLKIFLWSCALFFLFFFGRSILRSLANVLLLPFTLVSSLPKLAAGQDAKQEQINPKKTKSV